MRVALARRLGSPRMTFEALSFVSMPWQLLVSPSLQVGTLQALAEELDIPCVSHSFHLQFQADLLGRDRKASLGFSIEDYVAISDQWAQVGAGEWIFAVPPLRRCSADKDSRYARLLQAHRMPKALRRKLPEVRNLVPAFLERCADEILGERPAAVGFTVTYSQTLPSLALARVLKQRDPTLRIALGGAGCEGPVGRALLDAYGFVDVVVRGKVESVAEALLASLATRAPVPPLPGICYREEGRIVAEAGQPADEGSMDAFPLPAFDEYFDRLEDSPLAGQIAPELPIETARGCWWGAKSHCTFCGLNGTSMDFRSKSAARVLSELEHQAVRYSVLDFTAVDNIMDTRYFDTLLPLLRERELDLRIFYEVKSNLTRDQVRALRDAGVRRIQPGIESLSTPILRLMRKGATALQNIRLLKWCRAWGIRVEWNLLYGFPGEAPEEYARMAELLPALVHLSAPRLVRVVVDRFSPYHDHPAEHGLRIDGPRAHFGLLHDLEPAQLMELSSSFDCTFLDGRDPARYVGALREQVDRWATDAAANHGALSYRRGPSFAVITDRRTTSRAAQYTLNELEASIYLACEDGATIDTILGHLRHTRTAPTGDTDVRRVLAEFLAARLVYVESGRYLSLAVPEEATASRNAVAGSDRQLAGAR